MGKKAKIGKQRRDKYYQLAKETGYRSRAAFKLIQLNRKFEFLSRSRVVVDLCAAPGGWTQVAAQNCPPNSVVLAVDLVPIRPISGSGSEVILMQGDITTDKTRVDIEGRLGRQRVDCVLNDGAPNVGQNWIQDAFSQAQLTLSALKLATALLRPGGVFVTKVFRSADYNALLTVFKHLFKKVNATKPSASRNESAEIFVVCIGFKPPIDKKSLRTTLDPKLVFKQADSAPPKATLGTVVGAKKQRAEGYEDGKEMLHTRLSAKAFVDADNDQEALEMLAAGYEMRLDDPKLEENASSELRECMKDLKVLGKRSIRELLLWRNRMRQLLKPQGEPELTEENEKTSPKPQELDPEQIVEEVKEAERVALKKARRKYLKEVAKRKKREDLKMIIRGDVPDYPEEEDLFNLKTLRAAALNAGMSAGVAADPLDEEEANADAEWRARRRADLWFANIEGANSDSEGDEDEVALEAALAKAPPPKQAKKKKGRSNENVNLDDDVSSDEEVMQEEESAVESKGKSAEEEPSLVETSDIEMEDESESSDDDEEGSRTREVSEKVIDFSQDETGTSVATKQVVLDPVGLALGEKLVHSSKTRRDVLNAAWNRYTNDDDDNLPEWFVEDQRKHFRAQINVEPEAIREYRDRARGIDVRTVKKVAEAKARKKRRRMRKLARVSKKSNDIADNEEMSGAEKARQLKKLYASVKEKRDRVTLVPMTRGKQGRRARPAGRYKVVDRRYKKDLRGQQRAASKKASKKNAAAKRGKPQRAGKGKR